MRALFAIALAALLHAGCTTLECAEGTFSDGGKCVGYDPDDKTAPVTTVSPAGGRAREPIPNIVTLTTDETARIYYTTDGTDPDPATQTGETSPVAVVGVGQGTTLKYFAVDRAGNREQLATTTFDSDTVAPAPVAGVTLTLVGSTPTIGWTNPTDADFTGVVIARVADAIDVAPTPGKLYSAPTTLSTSLQVVSVGKATQFADSARPAGPVRYVLWTFDDLGNYSPAVSVRHEIPLGSLTAQLTWANNTLTMAQTPANLALAGTTATLAGTTLTVALSVKNNTAHYFQNMKAEITSVTNAAFASSDGTADGFAFRSFGPELLAPGATATRDLTFTGVGATTVTINIAFAHHPSLVATAGRGVQNVHVVDLGSGLVTPFLSTTSRGPNDRLNGRIRPPRLTGGRYLDIPTTHSTIERWDLVTRKFVSAARLVENDTDRVNVQGLYATPNGTYAYLKYGGRRRVAPAELVQLDEGLNIIARVALPNDNRGFARPAISADSTQMAIPLVGGVALIDLVNMVQLDATPSTPFSIDLFETGFAENIRAVQFFNGKTGLAVLARNNGRAAFIRRTADDYTVQAFQDATVTARAYSLATADDGKIWMALESGIRVFDPATGNVSSITYAQTPNGLSALEGKIYIIRTDRVTIDQVSNTGVVQRTITLPVNTGAHGHWLELAR